MTGKSESHKSWGMIGLARTFCSGPQQLFGSAVTNHTTVRLRIKHAHKKRDLGRDWTFGDDLICEVDMSPNQFADLICNMNVGDGVPCTIRYTQEDGNVEFKPETNKLETIYTDRVETDEKMIDRLYDTIRRLNNLVSTHKMPKGIGEEISRDLAALHKYLSGSGSDFLRKRAREEIESMVVEAKTQVSEYVNNKIYSVGLEKLVSMSEITPQLLEKEENSDETARITAADSFKVT